MCPPDFFTVRDVKNPFMDPDVGIDRAVAAQQWATLRDAFARFGMKPYVIEPVADLEDMVFTANQAFIGSGALHQRFVVPSRMRYPSRQREVPHVVAWFERNGFAVVDLGLTGDEYLEGHGDLLHHPKRDVVWAGYGFRSSAAGVERFSQAMQGESLSVQPLRLIDSTFYHLDTCFMPLNQEAAVVYPEAFEAVSLDALRTGWRRLHEVSRDDALQFVCNGAVANGHFVVGHVPSKLAEILAAEGLAPVRVDVSEFEKAGGSVFCMKAYLP